MEQRMDIAESDQAILKRLLVGREKYLLSFRNCGLGDNLFALAHGWLYCKKAGRSLIIDHAQSRYMDDPQVNSAHVLYEFPAEMDGVRIHSFPRLTWGMRRVLSSHRWAQHLYLISPRLYYLYRTIRHRWLKFLPDALHEIDLSYEEELLLVRTGEDPASRFIRFQGCHCHFTGEIRGFLRSIRPSLGIECEISSFLRDVPSRFVGVHVRYYSPQWVEFRHGDYWHDFGKAIAEIAALINEAIKGVSSYSGILLCTNSDLVERALRDIFPQIQTIPKDFGTDPTLELQDQHIADCGKHAVMEMFSLCRATALVRYPPTQSWFSELAALHVGCVSEPSSTSGANLHPEAL